MKKLSLRLLGPLVVLAIFAAAVWLLVREFQRFDYRDILHEVQEIRWRWILAAVAITHLNYAILVGYDLLAVRFVRELLPLWKVALASFTGYACSYNFGATLAGTSIRYRLYSAWGVPALKILQLLVILGLTFWFGVFALAGVVFLLAPLEIPRGALENIQLPFTDTRPFGAVLLAIALAYLSLAAWHRGSIKIFRWRLPVPPFKLSVYQVAIASADMLVAGWVLYVLMPHVKGGYPTVLCVYMVAYVAVVLSHVPGGYGVLEYAILKLMEVLELVSPDELPKIWAALFVFRIIYFWVPLLFSMVLLVGHEVMLQGFSWRALGGLWGRSGPAATGAETPSPTPDAEVSHGKR